MIYLMRTKKISQLSAENDYKIRKCSHVVDNHFLLMKTTREIVNEVYQQKLISICYLNITKPPIVDDLFAILIDSITK